MTEPLPLVSFEDFKRIAEEEGVINQGVVEELWVNRHLALRPLNEAMLRGAFKKLKVELNEVSL